MNITFYNCTSDPDVLNKNISVVSSLTGTLKNDCSIENPTIIIENSGMVNANYLYIPDFGRYYFIENQTILSNNRVRIDANVDVLYTYRSQISAIRAIIENSTTDNDNYLTSPLWVDKVKTSTKIINFPNGFNTDGAFILITAGG